jgi:hypothetical protein
VSEAFTCLVLGRSRYLALAGQEGEECRYLRFSHYPRVPFTVKEDEAPNPVDVYLLGPKTVMFSPDDVSDLIEEFGLARGNPGPYGGGHARYPPYRDRQSKRIIRPNYSPFAKKLPNNSAYF